MNLACLLLATLVMATCYADLKPGGLPEGFLTTALRNCAFARALRRPNLPPQRPKGTPKQYPGPKRTPKKNLEDGN